MPLAAPQIDQLRNAFQRGFPLVPRPFAAIGAQLGADEGEVLEALTQGQVEGWLSRVGPVFAPGRAGASTLVAMAVPPDELARVAAWVSGFAQVNHNYAREHRYNLWFVLTASDAAELQAVLGRLREGGAFPALDLPLLEGFHIDLGFDLGSGARGAPRAEGVPGEPDVLDSRQRALLAALQSGLPLVPEPFAAIAASIDWSEGEAREQVGVWLRSGLIKRFGIVVRHRELGFAANAMVVWNLADEVVRRAGQALAALPWITLCYRRPRRLPDWPYNLFCMIHGRDRASVLGQVEEAARRCDLAEVERAVLFSTQCFKQRGAIYQPEGAFHG